MRIPFWRGGIVSNRSVRAHSKRFLDLQTLESREVPALNPTGAEQEMLELLNNMRTDPQGHFSRLVSSTSPLTSPNADVQSALSFFQVNGTTLRNQWNSLTPVAPLAWNENLMTSAGNHNQAMIAADTQSHQLPGEQDIGGRANTAGYTGWTALAENIYAYSDSPFFGHAGFAIDWGGSAATGGLQSPAGHRNNMMSSSYREIGIRVTDETNPATDVGPQVVTQDFGNRSALNGGGYLLGVVYNDLNSNSFYNAGEGLGNVNIQITGASGFNRTLTSMTAGGYQTFLSPGSYTVTYSGGGLASPVVKNVTVGTANVKVDVISGVSVSQNNAPVLNVTPVQTLAPQATNNTNPSGTLVSTLLNGAASDANSGDTIGIAVTATGGTTGGTWQFSTNNGSNWTNFGTVTPATARLLGPTDLVRFIPVNNFAGAATLNYKAWDGTAGNDGDVSNATTGGGSTAFSTATETTTLRIQTAPTLDTSKLGTFPAIPEDSTAPTGASFNLILGQSFSDPNSSTTNGVAITNLSNMSDGVWQYRYSGSTTWVTITNVSPANALLLRGVDLIRFIPKTNFNGTVNLSFRAWDRTQGVLAGRWDVSSSDRVGGGSAFSTQTGTVNHVITSVNDAPVLNTSANPTLTNISGGIGTYTQNTVGALLGASVTDIDASPLTGIAVTAVTKSTAYVWEYSTDGGTNWFDLSAATASAARLLKSSDLVRVRKLTALAAPVQARLIFRAWDQTQGTAGSTFNISATGSYGGRTAFSAAFDTVYTNVS